jgi:hypothetical protein
MFRSATIMDLERWSSRCSNRWSPSIRLVTFVADRRNRRDLWCDQAAGARPQNVRWHFQYGRNGWRPDDPDLSFDPLALLADVEHRRSKIAAACAAAAESAKLAAEPRQMFQHR